MSGAAMDYTNQKHARQLIVCCDGTNNTLTAGVNDTNVVKLLNILTPATHDQKLYYDPGVGVGQALRRTLTRIEGLASGRGIYENIANAYKFLVQEYRDGDEIFLFGFSRGAFTVRAVAGMANLFGLVRAQPGFARSAGLHLFLPRGRPPSNGLTSYKKYRHIRHALSRDEARWKRRCGHRWRSTTPSMKSTAWSPWSGDWRRSGARASTAADLQQVPCGLFNCNYFVGYCSAATDRCGDNDAGI
ncbi:hypothetical protein RugamoR1_21510 [Rugamonas sp. R1(2021)]